MNQESNSAVGQPPDVGASRGAGVASPDPERWVVEFGGLIFKYALVRLRDPLKAEDAVRSKAG